MNLAIKWLMSESINDNNFLTHCTPIFEQFVKDMNAYDAIDKIWELKVQHNISDKAYMNVRNALNAQTRLVLTKAKHQIMHLETELLNLRKMYEH